MKPAIRMPTHDTAEGGGVSAGKKKRKTEEEFLPVLRTVGNDDARGGAR
jgi:hypothetical protein